MIPENDYSSAPSDHPELIASRRNHLSQSAAQVPSDAADCSRILITLEITDAETVEAYRSVHTDMLFDDMLHGSLLSMCTVVSRENAPAHPP